MSLHGKCVLLVMRNSYSSLQPERSLLTHLQTGASMGIGEAIAFSLAEQDASLALLSRSDVCSKV